MHLCTLNSELSTLHSQLTLAKDTPHYASSHPTRPAALYPLVSALGPAGAGAGGAAGDPDGLERHPEHRALELGRWPGGAEQRGDPGAADRDHLRAAALASGLAGAPAQRGPGLRLGDPADRAAAGQPDRPGI